MKFIPIDKELDAFKEHLNINERTIFSAKFGDGKTFFLDIFKKKYKDNYEFITIYPVNYQIADNKEIFEYIKRDILIQMVAKKMIEPTYEIPDSLIFQFFIMQNSNSFLGNLLQILPSLGVPEQMAYLFLTGYNALNWSSKMTKKYKEYKDAIESQDENHIIKTFIEHFSKEKGNPYEIDLITQIIIDNIQWFSKNNNKKVVLIIEDLDRIDPAHLFRILNIFSAHIDRVYQYQNSDKNDDENAMYPELLSNKFGFDNIIIVFDYKTTKNIFHHFYGHEANYIGYINKFASHQPFYYSIDDIARTYLYRIISEKCCIKKDSLRNITRQLNNRLDSLSVRDINNILGGINSYITEKQYNTNTGLIFNTKSPLTYTIAIFKLLGMSGKENIKDSILKLPPCELLNCINVFIFVQIKDSFRFKGESFFISKDYEKSEQIINKITIKKQETRQFLKNELNKDQINYCIDKAFKYIIK